MTHSIIWRNMVNTEKILNLKKLSRRLNDILKCNILNFMIKQADYSRHWNRVFGKLFSVT